LSLKKKKKIKLTIRGFKFKRSCKIWKRRWKPTSVRGKKKKTNRRLGL